jgi:hypothetical protein
VKKKSFLIIFLILCIAVCIFCFSNTKDWSKKDLYIYDSSGQIIEKPHNWDNDGDRRLHAFLGSAYCENCREDRESGITRKGVALGDDALEALSKYNLEGAFLAGVGEDSGELADLEEAIKKHSAFTIVFYLDKSFNALTQEELVDKQINYKYQISFHVKNGKIISYSVYEMLER